MGPSGGATGARRATGARHVPQDPILFTFFLIFTGTAVLATLALFARQSLLVAYIVLGALFGPWGLGLVQDAVVVSQVSHIGIMFLLFLLGLDLDPKDLVHSLRRTTLVTLASTLIFALAGIAIGLGTGFTPVESLVLGGAMTFSSTIIGLKLLPTTVLHHQRLGAIMISVLLLQDLLAIAFILLLGGASGDGQVLARMALSVLALPALVALAWAAARFLLLPLMARYDTIREYVFLIAIGWCLGLAQLASWLGLSAEVGAFIAGVALAMSPIAQYLAESLRPLRDFFLVLFFFALGAQFNLDRLGDVLVPAALAAGVAVVVKPWVFRRLLGRTGEAPGRSLEVGYRLGNLSEFSLLIAALAVQTGVIGERASLTLQFATLLSFLVSSYLVVLRFATPIAISDALRRD
jgi:Kef-type K+ transport system membrane component KefB